MTISYDKTGSLDMFPVYVYNVTTSTNADMLRKHYSDKTVIVRTTKKKLNIYW